MSIDVTIKTVTLTKSIARQLKVVTDIMPEKLKDWERAEIVGYLPYLAEKGIASILVKDPEGEAVLMSHYTAGYVFGSQNVQDARHIVLLK